MSQLNNARGVKKYVAGFLFGLICLVFVFFGLPQQVGPLGGGIVADVNGEIVSLAEFREMRARLEQSQNFGGMSGEFQKLIRQQLNQRSINYLVSEKLIAQQSLTEGIRVVDEEIRDIIVGIPAFQDDGVFQKSLYKQYIKQTRRTPGEFEDELREEGFRNRVQLLFQQSLRPIAQHVEFEKELQTQQVNFEYLQVRKSDLESKINVSASDISQRLKDEEFQKKVKADYDAKKDELQKKYEKVSAQHILVKVNKDDPKSEDKAKKTIAEIQKTLNADNFADIAKKQSEDVVSAKKGGDLGFFGRGRMVTEFENTAFSMKVGEISAPIKTQFGYHIIKLNAKEGDTFESIQEKLAEEAIKSEKSNVAYESLQKALEGGDTELKKWMKANNQTWKATGFFDLAAQSVPRLGADDEVRKEVFRLFHSADKMSTKAVALTDSQVVLKLKETKKSEEKPTETITQSLQSNAALGAMNDWVEKVRENSKVVINNELIR